MNLALLANSLDGSSDPAVDRARDRCVTLVLFFAAVVLYAPGIFWGLPEASSPTMIESQVADELGPWGVFIQLNAALRGEGLGAPQWPLAHYLVVALFYAPYLLFQLATGGWANPTFTYPFGFRDPVTALQTLAVIARMVSVLMGGGAVVATYWIGRNLWDRASGFLAAVFLMLLPTMFRYARTSNVDVPSFFWASLVLAVFARFLQDGVLTLPRSVWIGLLTAVAVATKDQNFAVLALLPLAMLPLHIRSQRKHGGLESANLWKAPLVGGLVCAGVYVLLSGVWRPSVYLHHLDHLLTPGRASNFYRLPPTLAGYATLGYEALSHLVNSNLGWLLSATAMLGVFLCWRSPRRALALLLPIPSLFFLGLVPVRYVTVRYVVPWALVLVCFAGYAIATGLRENRKWLRLAAWAALLVICTVSFLRGAELTYLQYRGTLYQASQWLQSHVRPSDQVEYFGWPRRVVFLPQLNGRASWLFSAVGQDPGSGALSGEFVLLIGAPDLEVHGACPRWVHQALNDGSLGYVLAARFRPHSFLSQPVVRNPEVQIFVRKERAPEILRSGSPPH